MKLQCGFHFDYDPATLSPRGRRCKRDAVEIIKWKDGRESQACGAHGMTALDESARNLVATVMAVKDAE